MKAWEWQQWWQQQRLEQAPVASLWGDADVSSRCRRWQAKQQQ
jgi:hypothetical protein